MAAAFITIPIYLDTIGEVRFGVLAIASLALGVPIAALFGVFNGAFQGCVSFL